jgi:hypothetical protein
MRVRATMAKMTDEELAEWRDMDDAYKREDESITRQVIGWGLFTLAMGAWGIYGLVEIAQQVLGGR